MKWFDNTALTIVIIGAVNWLLIGIFKFDLVAFLFGNMSWLSRIIYTIVGLCGLYLISLFGRIKACQNRKRPFSVLYQNWGRSLFYSLIPAEKRRFIS